MRTQSQISSCLGSAVLAALVALLLPSAPAWAVTIDDLTPVYFDGAGGYGFGMTGRSGEARMADFAATSDDQWISAPGPDIRITQRIETVHRAPGRSSPGDPTIVDSIWTVTNVGAGDLVAPLLVFTSLDPLGTHSVGSSKPLQGLDANLLHLLAYSYAETDYMFGAALLPDLRDGDSAEFTVRYIAASRLQETSAGRSLAPFGVSLLGTYTGVPEPSTLTLLSMGLLVTGTRGFRRRLGSKSAGSSGFQTRH